MVGGALGGWGRLATEEGEALVRVDMDLDIENEQVDAEFFWI